MSHRTDGRQVVRPGDTTIGRELLHRLCTLLLECGEWDIGRNASSVIQQCGLVLFVGSRRRRCGRITGTTRLDRIMNPPSRPIGMCGGMRIRLGESERRGSGGIRGW